MCKNTKQSIHAGVSSRDKTVIHHYGAQRTNHTLEILLLQISIFSLFCTFLYLHNPFSTPGHCNNTCIWPNFNLKAAALASLDSPMALIAAALGWWRQKQSRRSLRSYCVRSETAAQDRGFASLHLRQLLRNYEWSPHIQLIQTKLYAAKEFALLFYSLLRNILCFLKPQNRAK